MGGVEMYIPKKRFYCSGLGNDGGRSSEKKEGGDDLIIIKISIITRRSVWLVQLLNRQIITIFLGFLNNQPILLLW